MSSRPKPEIHLTTSNAIKPGQPKSSRPNQHSVETVFSKILTEHFHSTDQSRPSVLKLSAKDTLKKHSSTSKTSRSLPSRHQKHDQAKTQSPTGTRVSLPIHHIFSCQKTRRSPPLSASSGDRGGVSFRRRPLRWRGF